MSTTPVTSLAARRQRGRAATAAVTLAATTLAGSIGLAGPAQAAPGPGAPVRPADCQPGRHGFVATPRHVPDAITKERVHLVAREVLELRQGRLNGRRVIWARVLGTLHPNDRFWLDWSRDGGRTFLRCGPFLVGNRRVAAWTPAHPANPGARWVFRAGAQRAPSTRAPAYTGWWS